MATVYLMALNLKNAEVERLAAEVAEIAGESKTEAIRKSLLERRERLRFRVRRGDRALELRQFLEREVWPRVPASERGRRLSRKEEADLLGGDPSDGR